MIFVSSTCFQFDVIENLSIPLSGDLFKVEFSGGGTHHSLNVVCENIRSFLEHSDTNIRVHNYFPPPASSVIMNFASGNDRELLGSFAVTETAIALCAEFDVPYYSIHPGYLAQAGNENKNGHFDFKNESFLSYTKAFENLIPNLMNLRAMAAAKGVRLALENLFPRHGVIDSLNNTFEEFDEILSSLPDDMLILLDLGHLNVSASALSFDRFDYLRRLSEKYGERIVEAHISGNDGSDDQHLPVDEGDWQWDAIALLRDLPGISGDGIDFTLEARKIPLERIKSIVSRMKRVSTP